MATIEDLQQQVERLSAIVADLSRWMEEREYQQIKAPLDDQSKAAIGGLIGAGAIDVPLTASVTVGAIPATFTVPAPYSGARAVFIDGVLFKIPVL